MTNPSEGAVTRSDGETDANEDRALVHLIERAESGDHRAAEEMFAALYRELHRLAEVQLRRHGPALSLGTTTLLHEAYLHLARHEDTRFVNRAHFLGYAARAMRWIVIDYARRARAQRRGGGARAIELTDGIVADSPGMTAAELEHLSDALDQLTAIDAPLAQLVDLHFFCGFTFGEIAALRDVSERTVQRDWRKARLLLHHALLEDSGVASDAAP
jgi:RNA polymerase sigma factor (TIGR02999 family)